MNRHTEQTTFFQTLGALAAFMLWTAAICYVDVWPIGPEGSAAKPTADPSGPMGRKGPPWALRR